MIGDAGGGGGQHEPTSHHHHRIVLALMEHYADEPELHDKKDYVETSECSGIIEKIHVITQENAGGGAQVGHDEQHHRGDQTKTQQGAHNSEAKQCARVLVLEVAKGVEVIFDQGHVVDGKEVLDAHYQRPKSRQQDLDHGRGCS